MLFPIFIVIGDSRPLKNTPISNLFKQQLQLMFTFIVAVPASGRSNYDGSKTGSMLTKYKSAKFHIRLGCWMSPTNALFKYSLKKKVDAFYFFTLQIKCRTFIQETGI